MTTPTLRLLPLIPAIALAGCAMEPRPASASPPPAPAADHRFDKVWVEVWGKSVENKDFYNYGWINQWEYDRIVYSGKYPEVLRLNDMHFYGDDGVILLQDDEKTGVSLIRTEKIVRISLIHAQDIEALRKAESEREAKKKAAKNQPPPAP